MNTHTRNKKKTGTLTDTAVEIAGAVLVQRSNFEHPLKELATLPESHPFLLAVASCHSLIRIQDKLTGYSVDQKMFEAIEWVIFYCDSQYLIETKTLFGSIPHTSNICE